ncbi:serine O-acetyltransferase [Orrella marina]|uniref:Serine acetyltransferase n=1 Tax=Orrella marina TaxID=2163011 RepID=A0A2R4XIS4_9BURK|nr:serine O-acetyltransferase [Orrella marina]
MFERIREDISCILERDPAARSRLEVITCYPGLHAILIHRMAHRLWAGGWYWLGRFISHLGRILTGIEIHPGATLGRRVFIDHGHGVVIGETAEVGDECTIYQGVTLGGTKLYKGEKRHPTLGQGVVVGAGAQVLGGFTVGDGARIGSNAVVVKPVPAGATAVGNPARIIEHRDNQDNTAARARPFVDPQQPIAPPPLSTQDLTGCCNEGQLDTRPLQEMLSNNGKGGPQANAAGRAASTQSNGAPNAMSSARTSGTSYSTSTDTQESKQSQAQNQTDTDSGFSAYAVDSSDTDPLVKVVQELIEHAARQDARITQLCQAIESLGKKIEQPENGSLDTERLNKLVE